ncbi:MAG: hypothetical protein JO347_05540 [Candidatus Eremiobacteraeota bacterium]|nr:hypothetical protein [Candidatus Eremiobacteraeota bacterium]MBV8281512.1 hypothetical protein [Candidatus Eremiobacteraeota bacterium]
MSWEALTAIASLITAAVIAVTAIVAIVQIRHLRTANQLAAALTLYEEFDNADFRVARTFVDTELEERMKDPVFRDELLSGKFDRNVHLEIRVGNYWEKFGLLMRTGLLDQTLFLDWGTGGCIRDWRAMREVTRLIRVRVPPVWRDFEYCARLSAAHLAKIGRHPLQLPKWSEGYEDLEIREPATRQ